MSDDKLPDWVREATEPTDAEVARVDPSPSEPLLRAARAATGPSDVEVQRLVARLEAAEVAPALGWLPLGAVGLAAAALVAVVLWVSAPGSSPSTTGSPAVAEVAALHEGTTRQLAGPATLGPSIEVVGVAVVQIARTGPRGNVVLLREGSTRWSVDPDGPERALTVRAGEVDVRVVGTVFEVMRLGGTVAVSVERGRVEVESPDGVQELTAGGRVELPDHRVALAPVPDEPSEVAAGPVVANGDPGAEPASDSAATPAPPSDPAAAARAFAVIQDRIDAGDDAHELVSALEAFLAAHGDSVLAPEAAWERLRLKSTVEAPWLVAPEVKAAADADPESRRWLDLLELHATLARDGMQDCTTALPSYRTVAAHGSGRQQAEAEAYRGLCAARLEFADEALIALNRSLELGVTPPLADEVRAALQALSTP